VIDWFVFIDESGDLGTHGTKFFVVAAVQVKEENALSRIIRKARQRKLKKRLSEAPEIKGFNSNPEVRRFILKRIAAADCKIYALAVEKANHCPNHVGTKPALQLALPSPVPADRRNAGQACL